MGLWPWKKEAPQDPWEFLTSELLYLRPLIGGWPPSVTDLTEVTRRWENAVRVADEYAEQTANSIDAGWAMGELLRLGHNFDAHLTSPLGKAILAQAPSHWRARNLGECASQILWQLIQEVPNDYRPLLSMACLTLTSAEGGGDKTEELFHRAAKLAPPSYRSEISQGLAFACLKQKRTPEAIRYFERCIAEGDDRPHLQEILSQLRAGNEGISRHSSPAGWRLHSHADQRGDYLMYIGTPPGNPIRWSRIRQLTNENAVTEDGSTVPLSAVVAFLVAYPNGQLLEIEGAERLPLPRGIRGLEPKPVQRADRLRMGDLESGEAFARVHHTPTTQLPKRPGYYATTLSNVGIDRVRILKFAGYRKHGEFWVAANFYSDEEFRTWYGMGNQIWLPPGQQVVDPNNWGDPPVLWAYFGETGSGKSFIAGAVLNRPI